MKRNRGQVDMTNGPLVPRIIAFSVPLILSGLLQLFFNAADIIVVGRWAGSSALAAVGATGSLTNLIVTLFIGLSVGTSVVVAQAYGAGDMARVSRTVHTSVAAALISGVLLTAFCLVFSRALLQMMGTPEDIIDQSDRYMRYYFCGMTSTMVYNFGSAVLRSLGDTRRPLIFLAIAGVINVGLNMFFVIALKMGVTGVALATAISQTVSAALVVAFLMRSNNCARLFLRDIRVHRAELAAMLRHGLPAGLQGATFAISNVLIQSSINGFGSVAVSGSAAAGSIEGFVYVCMNAFHHAALTFTGQNVGAGQYRRAGRVLWVCLMLVTAVGAAVSMVAYGFGRPLLGLYVTDSPEAIEFGLVRLGIICTTYFTCGQLDVATGQLRGLGKSMLPMIISVVGVCGLRIAWLYTFFAANPTMEVLFYSYPLSWVVTLAVQLACCFAVQKRALAARNAARA